MLTLLLCLFILTVHAWPPPPYSQEHDELAQCPIWEQEEDDILRYYGIDRFFPGAALINQGEGWRARPQEMTDERIRYKEEEWRRRNKGMVDEECCLPRL